jgi:glycosyltransferase involved in cell wall biosynthesis
MRIGVMLRAIDEKGGIGVYARYITQELLHLDHQNKYILYYCNADNIGRFAHHNNVVERVLSAPNKIFWDQVRIPYACWKDRVDVVFHPKFTVPLFSSSKSVMVLHGAGWFMPEFSKLWNKWDLRYVRIMMPLYCKRASAVLSVSQITTDTFNRVTNSPEGKITTVYFAPGKHFKRVENQERLQKVQAKYDLPKGFIFTLTGYDRGPRKNIEGILKAYEIHHGKTAHKLIIGGRDCDRFKYDYGIPDNGYGQDIYFPGWIAQEDLPAIYTLADLFLYPSRVEAFPIPVTEALACGTPIVTSDANGLKEIAGDAALFVNPDDTNDIANAITEVLSDSDLQRSLSTKGLVQAQKYSWEKCARQTLDILESVVG